MPNWSVSRPWTAMALAASLCCGCEEPPDNSPAQQGQERLVGTWLREYQEDATRVRRVLVLNRLGTFRELSSVAQAGIPVAEHAHEGEWLFDGINLKRRYTRVDGRLPAAPMVPFATLQVEFRSRYEFIGTDNVRRRQVRYHRVAEGTLP